MNDAQAIFELAMKHIYGDDVEENNSLAAKLLAQARALGHIEAAYNLGICYHYGYGVKTDLAQAYALYLESANAGYGKGIELMGRFYNQGIYVQKDRALAEMWLNRAIATGEPDVVEEARRELNRK